jgi:hypothetical protein
VRCARRRGALRNRSIARLAAGRNIHGGPLHGETNAYVRSISLCTDVCIARMPAMGRGGGVNEHYCEKMPIGCRLFLCACCYSDV